VILLALSAGSGRAQAPVEDTGEASLTAVVSSRISYQGVLSEGGVPVTGTRDLIFRLYTNSTCTAQVGGDINKPGVGLSNGFFTVELDVDQAHFNGQGLWLKVFTGATGLGCQALLPAPYALSLRPGAQISASTSNNILRLANSYTAGTSGSALYATSAAPTAPTVAGYHNGDGPGIYGYTAGVYPAVEGMHGGDGSAVAGYVSRPAAVGVLGANTSSGGTGVKGTSEGGIGVEGRGGGISYAGVLGSGASYGGHFTADVGYGVYATGPLGAANFDGDVRQTRSADGLMKAAVYASCGTSSSIYRSFSTVGGAISIAAGPSAGRCTIDFGFKVNDRFFTATGMSTSDVRGASCYWGATETKLDCIRWNDAGAGVSGHIMVVIY
jgi:hypothetical protein